jgi:hypothetical protein
VRARNLSRSETVRCHQPGVCAPPLSAPQKHSAAIPKSTSPAVSLPPQGGLRLNGAATDGLCEAKGAGGEEDDGGGLGRGNNPAGELLALERG